MRILILGGTVFLGRHLVECALQQGHSVTLFHRGIHGRELFPAIDRRLGDRCQGLEELGAGEWDVCVDTCGYLPGVVRKSAGALRARVGAYLFVSSVSVYTDFSHPGITEQSPVALLRNPETQEISGETYGPLKAACEQEVLHCFGEHAMIVRPGLLVGPRDPTDRFTYWLLRLAKGGRVLVPEPRDTPVQVLDARDLAAWLVLAAEQGLGGIYNAVGPASPHTFAQLLDVCSSACQERPNLVWVDGDWLLAEGVAAWTEVPLWLGDPRLAGMNQVNCDRARGAGLTCRPLRETAKATLDWAKGWAENRALRAGLSAEREAQLLAKWARMAGLH